MLQSCRQVHLSSFRLMLYLFLGCITPTMCANMATTCLHEQSVMQNGNCYVYLGDNTTAVNFDDAWMKCRTANTKLFGGKARYARVATFPTPDDYICVMKQVWDWTCDPNALVMIGGYVEPFAAGNDLDAYTWIKITHADPMSTITAGGWGGGIDNYAAVGASAFLAANLSSSIKLSGYQDFVDEGGPPTRFICEFGRLSFFVCFQV